MTSCLVKQKAVTNMHVHVTCLYVICDSHRWKTNIIPSCISTTSLHLKCCISELPLKVGLNGIRCCSASNARVMFVFYPGLPHNLLGKHISLVNIPESRDAMSLQMPCLSCHMTDTMSLWSHDRHTVSLQSHDRRHVSPVT